MSKKESAEYSLFGDLEGMTVKRLRDLLSEYPDDAHICVRTEPIYIFGGWSDQEREFFVIVWEE